MSPDQHVGRTTENSTQAALSAVELRLHAVETRMTRLESMAARVGDLHASVEDLKASVEDLKASVGNMQASLDTLDATLAALVKSAAASSASAVSASGASQDATTGMASTTSAPSAPTVEVDAPPSAAVAIRPAPVLGGLASLTHEVDASTEASLTVHIASASDIVDARLHNMREIEAASPPGAPPASAVVIGPGPSAATAARTGQSLAFHIAAASEPSASSVLRGPSVDSPRGSCPWALRASPTACPRSGLNASGRERRPPWRPDRRQQGSPLSCASPWWRVGPRPSA